MMVPLLPKAPKNADADTESLLNKFLVKNDLKFLENYLLLQDGKPGESASPALPPSPRFPPKSPRSRKARTHKVPVPPNPLPMEIVAGIQAGLRYQSLVAVADDEETDSDDELNVETYVKRTSDLVLYYKMFLYWQKLLLLATNLSINNANHPVAKLLRTQHGLFQEAVEFLNEVMGPVVEDECGTSFDSFEYSTLETNSRHQILKSRLFADVNPAISNTFLLIHWILRNYEQLTFRNLNYLLFLAGCYEPSPEAPVKSELKKLKSCLRCRKNKIKCDLMTKFPYLCLNCFKKNANLIKLTVRRMEEDEKAPEAPLANYFESMAVQMDRTLSLATTASSMTTASLPPTLIGSCDCGSKSCVSWAREGRTDLVDPKLAVFLQLFGIDVKSVLDQEMVFSADTLGEGDWGAATALSCKVQLIPSDLILKKKSLKKMSLMKELKEDIESLKLQIDEMVVREQEMLTELLEKKVEYSDPRLGRLAEMKLQYKKPMGNILSTNDLLVLNGIAPVMRKRKKEFKEYFDYLEKAVAKDGQVRSIKRRTRPDNDDGDLLDISRLVGPG